MPSTEADKRICVACNTAYSVAEYDSAYFDPPHDYESGCSTHCLACWLGVGPTEIDRD